MKKSAERMLTEVETELMGILWRLGEGSVGDVLENLPADRDLAYTSVSTVLRILEQKKVLKARKEGRGHVYVPLVQKADYEARSVKHLVKSVFDGTPMALARQLIAAGDLSSEDLRELKKLLEKKESGS